MNHNFSTYQSVFTWRYGSDEMRRLFSEEYKHQTWRRIWVALAKAQHEAGLVSQAELDDLVKNQENLSLADIHAFEKETQHDVMAGIKEFASKSRIGGGKVHLGATSNDVTDNTEMLVIEEALGLVEQQLKQLLTTFAEKIEQYADTACMGFTHIQPAEPTTVGYRLAFYAQDLLLNFEMLRFLKVFIKAKGMKGAVGTSASYVSILQGTNMTAYEMEEKVMKKLGLHSSLIATQVCTRLYEYYLLSLLVGIASSIAKFAGDVRILQTPAYGEWSEPFAKTQVGSSAMPFKKNPINAENICSLARYITHLPAVAAENMALSHLERTLDDSANRRVIISESFLAADEIMKRCGKLISGLVINHERIKKNLETYGPFSASEEILMSTVKKGASRQDMHEVIREIAMYAWNEIQSGKLNPMKKLLQENQKIKKFVSKEEIEHALDISRHVGDAPERARKLVEQIKKLA